MNLPATGAPDYCTPAAVSELGIPTIIVALVPSLIAVYLEELIPVILLSN